MYVRFFLLFLFFQIGLFAQSFTLTVHNPSDFSRTYETIEVNLNDLLKFKGLKEAKAVQVQDKNGRLLCSQIIKGVDTGEDDIVIFQSDFEAGEGRTFTITFVDQAEVCTPITDGKFVLPREDFAWESDRIAFRMYGPALAKEVNNGIDVWTKRVSYPIVAKWYKMSEGSAPGKDTYHIDSGEGADFFSVGRTLGAGSSCLLFGDSLYQPGVFSRYKLIAAGPLRVCFELYYDSLFVNGTLVQEKKRISIDAHSNMNKIVATYYYDTTKLTTRQHFAAGLVKRRNISAYYNKEGGWMSTWGPVNDDSTNGALGLALYIPAKFSPAFSEGIQQYLGKGQMAFPAKFYYYSGAGWTRQGICADETGWKEYVQYFVHCKEQPVIVLLQ